MTGNLVRAIDARPCSNTPGRDYREILGYIGKIFADIGNITVRTNNTGFLFY